MELTEAGKTFFICVAVLIVWSTILTKGWVARLARNNALDAINPKDLKSKTSKQKNIQAQPVKSSKIQFAYLFAVVFSISALFFPFSYWVSIGIYNLSTKPTYSAKIVSYTSEWVETERTDSNNNRYTVEELRHTAQVTFTDKDNRTLTLDNSIRSTAIPVVGESIKIVYEDGDQRVVEKSIRSFLLYFAASFMLFIQGFVLVAIIAYGLNREMEPYIRFARFFIYRVVIPLGTMSMFAALVYVLFEYFMLGNPNAHPIWVVGICGFFALMLLPLIYHILSDWKLYK